MSALCRAYIFLISLRFAGSIPLFLWVMEKCRPVERQERNRHGMLSHVPGTEARDAVDPGNIEDVHEKIQVRMLGNVAQHAGGCEDVLVVNVFSHRKILLIVNNAQTSAAAAQSHRVDAL